METECILCGGCVDICPVNCIKILPLSHPVFLKIPQELNKELIKIQANIPADQRRILVKNEDICIKCGLCAKRCPVGAIIFEDFKEAKLTFTE